MKKLLYVTLILGSCVFGADTGDPQSHVVGQDKDQEIARNFVVGGSATETTPAQPGGLSSVTQSQNAGFEALRAKGRAVKDQKLSAQTLTDTNNY